MTEPEKAHHPVPDRLTPEEREVYEQVRRAQEAIDAALAALGSSRDARARALLRTVKDQAAGLRHVLEWQSERRSVHDGPGRPPRRDDDPSR